MISLAFALAAATVPPVPPPPDLKVADCEQPTYASDQFVCSNAGLLALDHQLRALLPLPAVTEEVSFEDQGAWFRRSRMCASKSDQEACLRAAYRERIAVVTALRAFVEEPPTWRAIKCGKRESQIADLPHGAVALRWQGQIVLANTATELASWTPFAWARSAGAKLDLRSLEGLKLRCTAKPRQ